MASGSGLMKVTRFKVLQDFKYGDVSDPYEMIAGNIMDCKDFSKNDLKQWMGLGWIEKV